MAFLSSFVRWITNTLGSTMKLISVLGNWIKDSASILTEKIRNAISKLVKWVRSETGGYQQLPRYGASPSFGDDLSIQKLRNHRYRNWSTICFIISLYDSWAWAYETAFFKKINLTFANVDTMVAAVFLIDLIFMSCLIFHGRKTDLANWRTWCNIFADVASIVFSSLHFVKGFPFPYEHYRYVQILRIVHLVRVILFASRLETDPHINYVAARSFKLLLVTIYYIHYTACLFYLIATLYPDSESWIGLTGDTTGNFNLYCLSVYFAFSTATTVGYGDLHPVNTAEYGTAVIIMIGGIVYMAYTIGSVTNIVAAGNDPTSKYRKKLEAILGFAKKNKLPLDLQDQMSSHLLLHHKIEEENLDQDILKEFHPSIRSKVSKCLFYDIIRKVYLFEGLPDDILMRIICKLKVSYVPPGENLFEEGDLSTGFYIIVTGKVALIDSKDGHIQIDQLQGGGILGKIAALFSRSQFFTACSLEICQLLYLEMISLLNIIRDNDDSQSKIKSNLYKYLRSNAMLKGSYQEFERTGISLDILTSQGNAKSDSGLVPKPPLTVPEFHMKEVGAQATREKRRVGLQNLGNNCYINCAIQCLSHTIPLRDYLLRVDEKLDGEVGQHFQELVRQLQTSQTASVDPCKFMEKFQQHYPKLSLSEQHDSEEFLTTLFESLEKDTSTIKEIFQVHTNRIYKCSSCKMELLKEQKEEVFYILPLQVALPDIRYMFNTHTFILYENSRQCELEMQGGKSRKAHISGKDAW